MHRPRRDRASARNLPARARAASRSLTPRGWLDAIERTLRAARLSFGHGTANARDEAAWLLAHALRLSHEELSRSAGREVTRSEERRVLRLVAERMRTRKPLAYLIREAWLGDRRFYVDERALVPRSFIAELLREKLRPWVSGPVGRALDLCTGSGCLAILVALAFPRARVDATDISRPALAVARKNVDAYRLRRRIGLLRSDLFPSARDRYDLIVANPPYVDAAAMRKLPPEYRREPAVALAGGPDGLSFVRRILEGAGRFLNPGGWLVVEVGHNRRRVERAFPGLPFTWAETSAGDDCVFLLSREDLYNIRP